MRNPNIFESLGLLKEFEVPIGSVLDVGIQHSTPVLMRLFPDLHHHLFEPVQEYYPKIKANYAEIDHTLVEVAVSDVAAELNLHTQKKTRGDEISHSFLVDKEDDSTRKIRSITLDEYCQTCPEQGPFLLKIDVEGADVPTRILRGARRSLAQTSVVAIEMTVDKFMERAIVLHEAGFDLWDLCDLCYYGRCLWQADAVFVRRDIKGSIPQLSPMHQPPFDPAEWQSGLWNNNL